MVKYQKVLTSDFIKTLYTHVHKGVVYEYNSENARKVYIHGKNHGKLMKITVFYVYYENH